MKAFMVSETDFPDCPWRKHWFPGMSLQLDGRAEREESSRDSAADKLARLPLRTFADLPNVCSGHRGDPGQPADHPGRGLAAKKAQALHLRVL